MDHDVLLNGELDDFIATLASLTPAQWEVPSLCEGWRVQEVAAHVLAGLEFAAPGFVPVLVKSTFKVDAALDKAARKLSESATPQEIVARFQSNSKKGGLRRFISLPHLLGDVMVHHQDIRRPLGLTRTIPADRLRLVLDFYTSHFSFVGARSRSKGIALVASDIDWSRGEGPQARGPAEAIVMVLAGRRAALADLQGEGVEVLAARE